MFLFMFSSLIMHKTPEKFDLRNIKAKEIEFSQYNHKADVWEIWRYYEGINIGNEISKDENMKRPCCILQNNTGNGLLLVAPITSKYHSWLKKYLVPIKNYKRYWLIESWVILNQIKFISPKRLIGTHMEHKANKSLSKYILSQFKTII